MIPGEEPFYFATGRVPRFPVPFFDPTIDPYSPAEIASLVRSRNIRWLIVKTDLQTNEDPTPDRAETMNLLMRNSRSQRICADTMFTTASRRANQLYAFFFALPDRRNCSQSFSVWSAYATPNSAIASANALPVPM